MKKLTLIPFLLTFALPGVAQASTGVHGSNTLPFSSSDLLLLAIGSVVLAAVGLLVRHLTVMLEPSRRRSAAVLRTERASHSGFAQAAGSR